QARLRLRGRDGNVPHGLLLGRRSGPGRAGLGRVVLRRRDWLDPRDRAPLSVWNGPDALGRRMGVPLGQLRSEPSIPPPRILVGGSGLEPRARKRRLGVAVELGGQPSGGRLVRRPPLVGVSEPEQSGAGMVRGSRAVGGRLYMEHL